MSRITIEELEQLANEVQLNMEKVLSFVIGESGCSEFTNNSVSESECIKLFDNMGSEVFTEEKVSSILTSYDTSITIINEFDTMSESQNNQFQGDEQYDSNAFFGKKRRVSKKLKMLM
jgi:hypothetical protein